jgi:hypothetical protein
MTGVPSSSTTRPLNPFWAKDNSVLARRTISMSNLRMRDNLVLLKQSYAFSVTGLHIYPGWYQQNISKIIRTFAPGGLMPDFYC